MADPGVTADAVHDVFRCTCPLWKPPSALHCEAIAGTIRRHVDEREWTRAWQAEAKANHKSVRRLHAALACDLPRLDERLSPILAPGDHAEALKNLVAAADRFRALWPEPGRHLKPAEPWHALVHALAPIARRALAEANPGRRVGLPRSAGSPLARALAGLVVLAGMPTTIGSPGAVGKHFVGFWPGPL